VAMQTDVLRQTITNVKVAGAMKQNTSRTKARLGWPFGLALGGLFVMALTGVATMAYFGYGNPDKYKEFGPWGDFFGGVLNPLLTFLTFSGVLITIMLQKIELSLTRDELERSADALEAQSTAIERQNFEATFFQMLALHNSIVNSIDLDLKNGARTQGRDCFRVFYTRLTKIYRANQGKGAKNHSDDKIVDLSYRLFWKEAQLDLGHYYRYLFNMIRFVKNSPYNDGYYIKLIRSQLSDQELLLLFYNCLTEQGKKFKEYAEEFALFDNMPVVRLLERHHRNRLAPSAFGDIT
jgi:hypothetical protein